MSTRHYINSRGPGRRQLDETDDRFVRDVAEVWLRDDHFPVPQRSEREECGVGDTEPAPPPSSHGRGVP